MNIINKKFSLRKIAVIFLVSFLWISCSVNKADEGSDFTVINNEGELSSRLDTLDIDIEVDTTETAASSKTFFKKTPSFDLKLIAELTPPEVNGSPVQATMVSILGGSARAAVSYNERGLAYKGAIDILQLPSGNSRNLRIRSGILFDNADVNAVHVNENRIWSALASESSKLVDEGEYSVIRQFSFNGFSISGESEVNASLPGFAANSTKEFGDNVFITSGDNAGLSVFNLDLSEQIAFIRITDARWVDVNDDWVVVLSGGDNGSLHKYDRASLQLIETYSFGGADTPEAKNTVEIVGNLAMIAAGKSGTHIMDLTNGQLLANIPIPDPARLGLSPDVVTTNAVSAEEEYIFISNGEAGVYVAEANLNLNEFRSGQNLTVDLIGQLKFDEKQSVNHVSYRGNNLIIATGLGGIKAVRLSRK
ncbi:MAG: hypothetical protein WD361_08640 [Gracilimonas sp.]